MARALPNVTIAGVNYTVDLRLEQLRRSDQPHIVIDFETVWDMLDFLDPLLSKDEYDAIFLPFLESIRTGEITNG